MKSLYSYLPRPNLLFKIRPYNLGRPVAMGGGEGGLSPPLEKFEPPPRLLPGHFLVWVKLSGNYRYWVLSPPPGILSAPPANDTWLQRWSWAGAPSKAFARGPGPPLPPPRYATACSPTGETCAKRDLHLRNKSKRQIGIDIDTMW